MSNDLQALYDGVAAGEVALTPSAVQSCVAAVDVYIEGLRNLFDGAMTSRRTPGFGTLSSGRALETKFDTLLGTDLPRVLTQHIEVALRLRDSFEAAGRNYAEADASATRTITIAGGG